jgi:hypothetical protein
MIATRSRSPTNYLTGLDIVDFLLELEHQQSWPEWYEYDGWVTNSAYLTARKGTVREIYNRTSS